MRVGVTAREALRSSEAPPEFEAAVAAHTHTQTQAQTVPGRRAGAAPVPSAAAAEEALDAVAAEAQA